jgi:glycosyltransferase involved in cell wall biosynthesis
MRIILFTENVQFGGLDTFCSTLIEAWPEPEDHFVVLCNASHPGIAALRTKLEGRCCFKSYSIPLSWSMARRMFGGHSIRLYFQPFFRILFFPMQYFLLCRLLRKQEADALLVVNGGYPGGESCRIANIVWSGLYQSSQARPSIHNVHNYAVQPRRAFGWYENLLDRWLVKSGARFVSVSRGCAESLKVRDSFKKGLSVDVIYNGIVVPPVVAGSHVADLRNLLHIGDEPCCLLLATYELRKGHRFLFEAFRMVSGSMPEAHLVVCGGGTAEERAQVEAARGEVAPDAKIHLLDFIPGGQQLIHQADVLVISSQEFESFGLTAVEAMLCGVPVVATRVGGLPEVLGEEGDGGYLVERDDAADFAARLLELLRSSERRKALGAQGRRRAERLFTAERMAEAYRKLLVGSANPALATGAGCATNSRSTSNAQQ